MEKGEIMAIQEQAGQDNEALQAEMQQRRANWDARTAALRKAGAPTFTGDVVDALKTLSTSIDRGYNPEDTTPYTGENGEILTITSLLSTIGKAPDEALKEEQRVQQGVEAARRHDIVIYQRMPKPPKGNVEESAIKFAKLSIENGIFTDFLVGEENMLYKWNDLEIGELPEKAVQIPQVSPEPISRFGEYDGNLQMFKQSPGEPNLDHLKFQRWLAENNRLEIATPVLRPSSGELALEHEKSNSQLNGLS